MAMARAHVRVKGRVQGVSFRAFTRNVAFRLQLHGWVRNLPDGSVEAAFEGDRTVIEQALEELRKGPPGSRVTGIDLTWEDGESESSEFEIRY